MDTTKARFGDKTKESGDILDQVEQQALVYQRGLSTALAGLLHEKTDGPWVRRRVETRDRDQGASDEEAS